ncbi:MAG: hypothetical protein GW779_01745 [Candidatus Altiarchaeum hamiconexum]|uniref:Uncharacterized protein n=1 Tax=Candidatus Altarchaeum hamiconexum TaxID=1803513 RepID=A0A8J7YY74_9ARCH|nr:hypothetical protein [Candidatus Altarchaeum hamiconexum]NCN68741.1 hypothetical protein [Candidatus Altarchaeum hamiconexum]NCS91133.1 hypothetical protein [Candidatus Altarchaeum hamiconexum]NCT00951.1 hypothetical protein [Candidatus Altarchaeum hamiconexum]
MGEKINDKCEDNEKKKNMLNLKQYPQNRQFRHYGFPIIVLTLTRILREEPDQE